MQQTDLMYALLDMFETTVPGICINDVTVPGYSKEEVRKTVIAMRDQRLIDVVTARDTTGAEYAGCIVGLAPRGGFLRGAHVKNRRPLAAMKES